MFSAAARALGKIGSMDAAPALIRALKDQNGYIHRNAVKVLKKISTPETLKAVEEYEYSKPKFKLVIIGVNLDPFDEPKSPRRWSLEAV